MCLNFSSSFLLSSAMETVITPIGCTALQSKKIHGVYFHPDSNRFSICCFGPVAWFVVLLGLLKLQHQKATVQTIEGTNIYKDIFTTLIFMVFECQGWMKWTALERVRKAAHTYTGWRNTFGSHLLCFQMNAVSVQQALAVPAGISNSVVQVPIQPLL